MPEFFKQVGAARFGVMAGVAAVLTAFFLYIAGAITEPPKSILFSGLESRDAAAVTGKLDGMAVKYDVKDGGTILVPADQVTKLRMALAQDNLPAAGVGYEIFDKSDSFGTTAFVQNINHQRALEGELSRSMQTIEGIRRRACIWSFRNADLFARRPAAFRLGGAEDRRPHGSRARCRPSRHLVAAAVAGLSPDRVAIVDDRGNLLAGGDDKSGPRCARPQPGRRHHQLRERLRQRIESIVSAWSAPTMSRSRSPPTSITTTPRPPAKTTIPTPRWCARPRPSSRTPPTPPAATMPCRWPMRCPAARPRRRYQQGLVGPHRGNHQLRNLQEGHHFDRGRWRRPQAVGGRGGGWFRRHGGGLQGTHPRRNEARSPPW